MRARARCLASVAAALACGCAAGCADGGDGTLADTGHELALPPFTVRGRWERPSPLRVRLDLVRGPLAAKLARGAFARAMAVWSDASDIELEVTEDDADVLVTWEAEGFGHDTSVARTTPVGPGCTVLVDAGREWTEASLFQAAVHELGHALGLGHTEDTAAVMHAQRETGRTQLGAADLAGLCSLYGGGSDGPGDLTVEGGPVLRRVAPPGRSDWTLFDTDGDGDDELLVWDLSSTGAGALTAYHFASGPRLERTVGPVLGVAGHGARVSLSAEEGERALVVEWPDGPEGTRVRRSFDAGGVLGEPAPDRTPSAPTMPRRDRPGRRDRGDLDGDGRPERVTARR